MPTYNDGSVPYGSQVVTIGGVAFVAEQINVTEPSNIIERMDELGVPSGQVIIGGFVNGTAVLQLATTSTLLPTFGGTFTLTRPGTPAVTYGAVLSEIGEAYAQTEALKVNVSFRKRYGG